LRWKAGKETLLYKKKPKKKRAIHPGLSTKQLRKDPTYKQFDTHDLRQRYKTMPKTLPSEANWSY
jgi:hypothetical protein